ncbi:hypothetical protein DRQ09_08140, partial [candidate division KSB1 bacterium]
MFDEPKDLAVNRLLESPDESSFVLDDSVYEETIKEDEEELQDQELIWEIRRSILTEGEKFEEKIQKDEKPGKKKKIFRRRRLGFLYLILKIFFGYKEFVNPIIPAIEGEEIEESLISGKIKQVGTREVEIERFQPLEKLEEKEEVKVKKKEETPFLKFTKRIGIKKSIGKFRKKFFTSNYIMGLDIGTNSVKLILVNKEKGGFSVEGYGIEEFSIKKGDKNTVKNLTYSINKIINREDLKISEVVVSFSDIPVMIKTEEFPGLNKKELNEAILWKVKKELSREFDDPIFRYKIIGSVKDKINVLIVVTSKKELDKNLNLLKEMGITPSKLTFPQLAIFDCFKYYYPGESEDGSLIVDIGGYKSTFIFIKNGIIELVRDINIGGENFTEALTGKKNINGTSLEIDYEKAEELKYDYGISFEGSVGKTPIGIPISQIGILLKPSIDKLISEIRRSLEFYSKMHPSSRIDNYYLTGGSSRLINLREVLSREIGVNFNNLDFFSKLNLSENVDSPDVFYRSAYSLTCALGLVIEGLDDFNFIYQDFKEERKKKLFNVISVISGILLLI